MPGEQLGPYRKPIAIVQSDATTYEPPLRGLCVQAAGDVKITTNNGLDEVWTCPAGYWIPRYITKVWDTGTTVTDANLFSGTDE